MVTAFTETFTAMPPPKSVVRLAARYLTTLEHEQQVTHLALMLFDGLQPLHGLAEEARLLLHCSALLHDIGRAAGRRAHHKAALRLILAAPLPPFAPREQMVIALAARYHRKALPCVQHRLFAELPAADQQLVSVLGGILRMADGLDRTHRSLVHALGCEITSAEICLHCVAVGRADAERAMALAKSTLLQKTFRRPITIRMK